VRQSGGDPGMANFGRLLGGIGRGFLGF